jgi:heme/copper-type cytochrome/quinol oxidase subunit 2
VRTFAFFLVALGLLVGRAPRLVAAQSSQVEIEWSLFNGILIVGIIVGIVVFGLLFYAIIRYREKPVKAGVAQ